MDIEIRKLYKTYGRKEALKGIDLHIGEGMFGLLGPNGAGKTTLMRILTTLLGKTSGEVTINGINIERKKSIREVVGYLPQDFSLYPGMTVYEAMDYLAVLSGVSPSRERRERVIELLEKVNLNNHLKTKVKALSGGMKRRLGIAQALINDPQLLIVDEPTAGLDPEERVRFRNLLSDFASRRTVILSTHIVEDVEFTCENLAVLKEGSILYKGSVRELLKKAEGSVWTASIDREDLDSIRKTHHIISTVSEGNLINARILSEQKPLENARQLEPSIEDAYMKLMSEVK
ncbi:MAG: ABC transporter ATP-binding protein [Bacillota bacterium]